MDRRGGGLSNRFGNKVRAWVIKEELAMRLWELPGAGLGGTDVEPLVGWAIRSRLERGCRDT